jgi:hypothetical protein
MHRCAALAHRTGMTTSVLVIGGRGFLGRRATEAIRAVDDVHVSTAGRSGAGAQTVPLDLCDESTFAVLDDYDIVVNCSDSVSAPPDDAVRYCREHGVTFLDAGGYAPMIERVMKQRAEGQGTAILGIGLFPGLTNLLARHVVDGRKAERLDVGIRLNPISGAGAGMASMMANAMGDPARSYRDGELVETAPLRAGLPLTFAGTRRKTITLRLPEVEMLRRTTGAPTIGAYMALAPGFLRPFARFMAFARPRGRGWFRRIMVGATTAMIRVMRGLVLRWRMAPIQLTAATDRARATLTVDNGIRAAAIAIAAAVSLIRARRRATPGTYLPDQVFALPEYIAEMHRLGSDDLELVTT